MLLDLLLLIEKEMTNPRNQGLQYPFMINLDRFNGSCSTLDDLPNRIRA